MKAENIFLRKPTYLFFLLISVSIFHSANIVFGAAAAARARGEMKVDAAAGAVPGAATVGNAYAYSDIIPRGFFGPDAATSGTLFVPPGPAVPIAPLTTPAPFTVPRAGITGFFLGPFAVPAGAGVADLGRAKLPNKTVTVQSSTAGAGSSALGVGAWTSVAGGPSLLSARANADVAAEAMARANDPFILPPSTYTYSPIITELFLSASGPDSLALLGFDADSSLVSSGLLWALGLGLTGNGDLEVGFQSSSILGLDDAVVRSNLLAALDRSGLDSVSLLAPYPLFSTTFVATESFRHEESVRALALTQVSEPSGLLLLVIGVIVLGFYLPGALYSTPVYGNQKCYRKAQHSYFSLARRALGVASMFFRQRLVTKIGFFTIA